MKTHPQICIGEYIDSYFPAVDGVIVTVQNYAKWMNKKPLRVLCRYYRSAERLCGYRSVQSHTLSFRTGAKAPSLPLRSPAPRLGIYDGTAPDVS